VDKTAALETEFGASSISLRFRRTTPDSSRRIEAFAIYRTGVSGLPTKLQPSLYHCLVATGGCPQSDGANRSGKAHRGTATLGPETHRKSGEAVSAPIARTIALAPLRLADPRRLSRNTPTCQAPREAPEIGNAPVRNQRNRPGAVHNGDHAEVDAAADDDKPHREAHHAKSGNTADEIEPICHCSRH
jgi:hypothetical protein